MRPARGELWRDLRALPRSVWILFAGTLINRFGTFVIPFLVLYLTSRGFSMEQAGVALGSYGVGHMFASFIGGRLADTIGRHRTIALSMFSSAAAMLALSQATTLPAVIAMAFAAGATGELYRPASSALVADLIPPERRVTAYAVYRLAINLGFAAGPATAGFLAERSYFAVFLVDAVTSSLFGVIALLFLPFGHRSESADRGWSTALRSASRNVPFLAFLAGATMLAIVDFQMQSTLALHVRDAGFSPSTFGALISLNGVLIILVELAITQWTRRFDARTTIAIGWLLLGVGFAATGMAHTIPALAATVVIWTIGEMICAPLTTVLVADAAPPELRGRFMGMFGFTWSIGLTLGPPIGTLVYDVAPAAVWIGCLILGIIGPGLVAFTGRNKTAARDLAADTI